VPWPNDVITRTVAGTYLTAAGEPAKGRVTFTPSTTVVDADDAVVVEDTIVAILDENGQFELDLPTTDNALLSPSGWAYKVNVRLHGVKPKSFYAFLPYGNGSTVDIATNRTSDSSLTSTIAISAPQSSGISEYSGPLSSENDEWPNDIITRTVTGLYVTADGESARGRVTFTPSSRIVDANDAVVVEGTLTAILDTSGFFEIDLPTTDNALLSPSGWAYIVSVRLYGVKPQNFYAFLPYGDGSPVDLLSDISLSGSLSEPILTGSTLSSQGSIGPSGPGVISGEGEPVSTVGFDGDIYIDAVDGAFYGPKANGEWPLSPFYAPSQLGAQRFIHTQAAASDTWNVTHALGGRPSVMVVDSAGTVVIGEIRYNSNTSITILFTAPFSGFAYLT
jgi:hypothetical protein